MTVTTPAKTRPARVFTATEPRHAPYAALLSQPRVKQYLTLRIACTDVQDADAAEIVAQTLEALWRCRNAADVPDSLERVIGLARTILDGKIADFFRRKAAEEKVLVDAATLVPQLDDDPPREPDDQPNYVDHLPPPRTITAATHLEAKEKLAFVQSAAKEVGLTDDLVEIMQAVDAKELTLEQAAAERGMKPGALRVRLHRIRKSLAEGWARHTALRSTTMLMLVMLTLLFLYAMSLAGARRSDPPPQRPPRTISTHDRREVAPQEPIGTAVPRPIGAKPSL